MTHIVGLNGKAEGMVLRQHEYEVAELRLEWCFVTTALGATYLGRLDRSGNTGGHPQVFANQLVLSPVFMHQLQSAQGPQGSVLQRNIIPPQAVLGARRVVLSTDMIVDFIPLSDCQEEELKELVTLLNKTEEGIAKRRAELAGIVTAPPGMVLPKIIPVR